MRDDLPAELLSDVVRFSAEHKRVGAQETEELVDLVTRAYRLGRKDQRDESRRPLIPGHSQR